MTDADLTFGGWDLALNHSGAVLIDLEGELVDVQYLTNQKGSADRARDHATYYNPKGGKGVDTNLRELNRLANHALWSRRIQAMWSPSYSYLEGYAYGTPKGEMTGEMAGAWKLLMWTARRPFRIIDVASIKMFAAHSGNAGKGAVMRAVRERWGQDFARFNKPIRNGKPAKDGRQTEEDLCDAYSAARMCRAEYMIRAGHILPRDLEHDAERRVYLRTTKTHAINVLARPWTLRS